MTSRISGGTRKSDTSWIILSTIAGIESGVLYSGVLESGLRRLVLDVVVGSVLVVEGSAVCQFVRRGKVQKIVAFLRFSN